MSYPTCLSPCLKSANPVHAQCQLLCLLSTSDRQASVPEQPQSVLPCSLPAKAGQYHAPIR